MEEHAVDVMKSSALGLSAYVALGLLLTSCAGPNLRPGFRAKEPVFERQWTLSTRTRTLLAGERGVEFSNPVLWENSLIFGTSEAGLVATYPSLGGQIRWVLPIRGGIVSELTQNSNSLYFGGADGFVYAVDAETGRVRWRHEVRNPKISKPTIHEGKLYVSTSDNTVYAIEALSGKWLWNYKRQSGASDSIFGASQPWTDGRRVLTGTSDGHLITLDALDGRLLSEKRLSMRPKFRDIDASVVSDDETFYIPTYDGSLHALKRKNLDPLWVYDSGGARAVTLDGDLLALASSDGNIHLIQKQTGKLVWKFQLDGGVPTSVVITQSYLLVGSSYQYLYAIDKKSGELRDRWNAGYGSGFSGNFAFDSATSILYGISGAANLYSFKIR